MKINKTATLVILLVGFFGIALFNQCTDKTPKGRVMTVDGLINAAELGKTLPHEHLLVDFVGADSIDNKRWDIEEVISVALPHLLEAKASGCKTFIDCTPDFLGRDAKLLKELSKTSGVQIISNTGLYGARDNKFLPQYAYSESAEELASRWLGEWENGIDDTGVKPGFIKIGVDEGSLSEIHKKLITAAGITHLQSGLTIASHTGTYPGAREQLDILNQMGIDASAFIWVHAQAEKEYSRHVELAKRGAWISLDGVDEDNALEYIHMISYLKDNDLLHKILLSQDAGWYSPGEENGGAFKPFSYLLEGFVPRLLDNGFSEDDIDQLLVKNPMDAFSIDVKTL